MTYGIGENNFWRAVSISTNPTGGSDFCVTRAGEKVCEVSLPSPGLHNVLNALAALVAALLLAKARELSWAPSSDRFIADATSFSVQRDAWVISKTVAALENYQGTARRMQHVGSIGTCTIFDDYAHHPTAIRAVIRAMRQRSQDARLVVVFQPHTFSRTEALLHEFANALSLADRVIVMSIFDARAENNLEFSSQVSGQDLARLTGDNSIYVASLRDAVRQLVIEASLGRSSQESAKNRTVFLCLGAGSSNQVATVALTSLSLVQNP